MTDLDAKQAQEKAIEQLKLMHEKLSLNKVATKLSQSVSSTYNKLGQDNPEKANKFVIRQATDSQGNNHALSLLVEAQELVNKVGDWPFTIKLMDNPGGTIKIQMQFDDFILHAIRDGTKAELFVNISDGGNHNQILPFNLKQHIPSEFPVKVQSLGVPYTVHATVKIDDQEYQFIPNKVAIEFDEQNRMKEVILQYRDTSKGVKLLLPFSWDPQTKIDHEKVILELGNGHQMHQELHSSSNKAIIIFDPVPYNQVVKIFLANDSLEILNHPDYQEIHVPPKSEGTYIVRVNTIEIFEKSEKKNLHPTKFVLRGYAYRSDGSPIYESEISDSKFRMFLVSDSGEVGIPTKRMAMQQNPTGEKPEWVSGYASIDPVEFHFQRGKLSSEDKVKIVAELTIDGVEYVCNKETVVDTLSKNLRGPSPGFPNLEYIINCEFAKK